MFMKRNLMKITIMGSESGHISSVFAYTRLLISHWTEVVPLLIALEAVER